jgi:hypothetical protein
LEWAGGGLNSEEELYPKLGIDGAAGGNGKFCNGDEQDNAGECATRGDSEFCEDDAYGDLGPDKELTDCGLL